jgi:hypothetical protein
METATKAQIIETTKISVKTLANLLSNITKSTICNITYLVDDSRSKTIKGVKQVQKLVNISAVYLNHDYTKKIINLTGNTNFVANELKGKTRICSTIIQSDKTGGLMIDGKILNSESINVLCYFHDGKEISEAQSIAKELWTPAYYNPRKTYTKGRGSVEVEDDFKIINTYLKRIVKIKLEGTLYYICH